MNRWLSLVVIGLAGSLARGPVVAGAEGPEQAAAARYFEEQIHPLLARHCLECHGSRKQESGLRLDRREAVLKGGDSGVPAAVPGEPDRSLLVQALRHEGELKMPPDERLPEAEISRLVEWIRQGIPWSSQMAAPAALTPEQALEQARREHWSLQPVSKPAWPVLRDPAWPHTGVDYFVLARLEAAGLRPAPPADRRTLLRRLSMDLWGLPPTMAEVESFVHDPAPDAYARRVDQWLASPRYGERWGRHWLDLARYADTRGYAFANDRRYPYAYTYRDYVIGAWNADKPYHEFLLEQLAADLRPSGGDRSALAALGFLTTGRKFNNRQDDLDDQIDVVSRGLQGLTVGCARCHDHKYDPIRQEDYYSLYGVFASSQEPEDLPLLVEPRESAAYEEFQRELGRLQQALENFKKSRHADFLQQSRERVVEYLTRLVVEKPESLQEKLPFLSLDPNDIRPRLLERWRAYVESRAKPSDPIFGLWGELIALPPAQFAADAPAVLARWCDEEATATKEARPVARLHPTIRERFHRQPPSSREQVAQHYAEVLTAAWKSWQDAGGDAAAFAKLAPADRTLAEIMAGTGTPTDIPLSELGSYLNRADRDQQRKLEKEVRAFQANSPVAPPRAMVLQEISPPHDPRVFLRGNPARPGKSVPRQFLPVVTGSGQRPFQRGSGRLELAEAIVAPENPLTRRVIANRVWMHHFGRSLVLTPSDFGVRCDRPLQAELLDYLAARLLEEGWSLKELHREILLSRTYQQSCEPLPETEQRDPENRLFGRMNRRRLDFESLRDGVLMATDRLEWTLGGRGYELTAAQPTSRRTVYATIDRQDLPNLLRVFDFPSPDQSQAERPRTTVPQQALFLLNSRFLLQQAEALATEVAGPREGDTERRIRVMYERILQRPPTAAEFHEAQEFLRTAGDTPQPPSDAWKQLAQALLLTNEFAFVD